MAEEAGVEPTGDGQRLPPDLKSGHPTGSISLPRAAYISPWRRVQSNP
jgi:hypothetical protein